MQHIYYVDNGYSGHWEVLDKEYEQGGVSKQLPLLMLWKHSVTLNSPACILLCSVPVSKFTIGTATTRTDTASAASSKE